MPVRTKPVPAGLSAKEQIIHRAALWAIKTKGSDTVSWLWRNLPEAQKSWFENERDFAERVNERVGMMEN